jgi:hypothetical protein
MYVVVMTNAPGKVPASVRVSEVMAGLSMLSASSSSDGNADADDGHQRFHS